MESKSYFVLGSDGFSDEPEKGWFPRHCAMVVYDDEDEFLKKMN